MTQLYPQSEEQTKMCTKCGVSKFYSEFSKNRTHLDGHRYWCKLCVRSYENKRNQQSNIRDKRYKYYKTWVENANNKEQRREYNKRYRETQFGKTRERIGQEVRVEVERGNIKRIGDCICADCGKQAHNYHHEDYSKPLDVIPLCGSCHRLRHTRSK